MCMLWKTCSKHGYMGKTVLNVYQKYEIARNNLAIFINSIGGNFSDRYRKVFKQFF